MKLFFTTCLTVFSLSLFATIQDEITVLHERAYTLLDTDRDSAFMIGLKTESLSREDGLLWEEANSIFIQAWVQENTRKSGEAFSSYFRALNILKNSDLRSKKEQKLHLQLTRNVGYILLDHHADHSAEIVFNEGLSQALSFDNFNEASRLLIALAQLQKARKDYKKTQEYIDKALSLKEGISKKNLIKILNQKGINEIDQGLSRESRKTFKNVLELISGNTELAYYQEEIQHNLAYTYFVDGQLDSALFFYLKARDSNKVFSDPLSYFLTEQDLSEVYFNLGRYQESINAGNQALLQYPLVKLNPDHFSLFTTLSKSYAALGDYKEAQKYAEMYMAENAKYLETQEMLMKVREEYKMEELTASFFMNADDLEDKSIYWIILSLISSSFTVILLAGMMKNHFTKRALQKSLQEITKDSWM